MQRIVIAQLCGWQDVLGRDADGCVIGLPPGFTEDQCPEGAYEEVPNYTTDLNAMHEAEKTLTMLQHINFRVALLEGHDDHRLQVSATARQRAEAFLRALGKWNDAR